MRPTCLPLPLLPLTGCPHWPPPSARAALLAACGAAVVLLAPMINAKSYIQLENERKAAAAKLA